MRRVFWNPTRSGLLDVKILAPADFLSQDELRAFLKRCRSPRDRAILLVAYRHGLRASEVGLLRVGDVDLPGRSLYCRRLRGSRSGRQPLGDDEMAVLGTLVGGRASPEPLFRSGRGLPISRKRLDAIMKQCGARAGVPAAKRHFQMLRYSLAAHLLQAGADPALTFEILGRRARGKARIREIARFLPSEKIVTLETRP